MILEHRVLLNIIRLAPGHSELATILPTQQVQTPSKEAGSHCLSNHPPTGADGKRIKLPSISDITEIDTTLIPKPPGEVGRPGRGRYNLQVALGWKVDLLWCFKVCHLAMR